MIEKTITLNKPEHPAAKILLVDDEPDLLKISSACLTHLGYETFLAKDAIRALQLIAKHPGIDIVITDIIMPGSMNGIDLIQTIARHHPKIKSIYTSGFPTDAFTEKDLATAGHTPLNKPYRLSKLAETITQLLNKNPTPPTTGNPNPPN